MRFSPDGRLLAAGDADGAIKVGKLLYNRQAVCNCRLSSFSQ